MSRNVAIVHLVNVCMGLIPTIAYVCPFHESHFGGHNYIGTYE